jgi:hypothetical protein
MECLNIDYRADPDLFTALDSIRLFISEASTCKSIDCYLMKLDTLINSVEETFGNKAEEVFRKILLCNEVRDSLRPLAEHIEVVESLALTDPRHRPVKRYMNLLIATLGTLQSTSKILEITRPPTYKIEQEEREIKSQLVQFEKRYNTIPVELASKPSIEPTEEYTSPPVHLERKALGSGLGLAPRIVYFVSWIMAIVGFVLPWFFVEARIPFFPVVSITAPIYGSDLIRMGEWLGPVIYITGLIVGLVVLLGLKNARAISVLTGTMLLLGLVITYSQLNSELQLLISYIENTLTPGSLSNLYYPDLRQYLKLSFGSGAFLGVLGGIIQVFIVPLTRKIK